MIDSETKSPSARASSNAAVDTYRGILRAALRMRRLMRKLYESYEITGAQFGLLCRIPPEGITLTQLAETAWADPGNTSGVVDRLVRDGWVVRRRSDEDRRVVTVSLSPLGKSRLGELIPRYTEAVERIMSAISPPENDTLAHLLRRLEIGLRDDLLIDLTTEEEK